MGRHRVNDKHEHVVFVYFAKANKDQVVPEKPTDVYKWFTLEELSDPQYGIVDNILFYATEALRELGKSAA
jgi:hypothetical protein